MNTAKRKQFQRSVRPVLYILVLLIVFPLLMSCGSSGYAEDNSSYIGDSFVTSDGLYFKNESDAEFGIAPGDDYYGELEAASGEESSSAALEDRKIIKNVTISAETKEYDSVKTSLEGLVSSLGGYVKQSTENGKSYYSGSGISRSSNYVLRIPAEKLDEFLDSVGGLVNVTSSNTSVDDITDTYLDIEARLNTLRAEEERLLALLEKGESLSDVIQLEERLSDVRYQIESYTSRLKSYDTLVAYSTVTIYIDEVIEYSPDPVKKVTFGERISKAFKTSWADFADGCRNFAVEFVYLIPTLLVLLFIAALIALLVFLIKKHCKKKKEKRIEMMRQYQMQAQNNAQSPEK